MTFLGIAKKKVVLSGADGGIIVFMIWSIIDWILRLLAAVICGAFIGAERERRQKNAGIRTHIIVAMASALMMIVSKYGFFDVIQVDGVSVDASRIAASVVSAIGFLGAGVIFVRSESAMGLTTAAGLWATVGVGMTFGAGMYALGIIATALMLLVQVILHSKRFPLSSGHMLGSLKVNLTKNGLTITSIRERLMADGILFKSFKVKRTSSGDKIFSALIYFSDGTKYAEILETLENADFVEELSILSSPGT